MKIEILSIQKGVDTDTDKLIKVYKSMSLPFAKIEDIMIFNKNISSSQAKSSVYAQEAYAKAFEPYLSHNAYCVAMDEDGDFLNSKEFAKIFENNSTIRFFIGGAYGFSKDFLNKNQKIVSLSRLTFAHKIAKLVLIEQIYRGLCIKFGHPYHKD